MNFLNQQTKVTLKNTIVILLTAMVLSFTASSCKDNDDKYIQPELVVNTELQGDAITFDKDGGSKEITFTTNRSKWTVTSSVDWLAISPTTGEAGEVKITIKALPNNSFARTGSITITSGITKKSITIKQDGEGGSADVVIFNENFSNGLGCWTSVKLETAGADWRAGKYIDEKTKEVKETYAKISAFNPKEKVGILTKSLLISPMIDFKTTTIFSFKYKSYYAVAGTTLKVVLLNKDKEIIGNALEIVDTAEPAKGYAKQYVDVTVGIPLNTEAKYIALYYEADKDHTTGFQVTDMKLVGGEGSTAADCSGSSNGNDDDDDNNPTNPAMTVVIFENSFAESLGCWMNKKEINTGAEWKLGKYIDKKTKEVKDSYIKISAFDYASKVGIPTKSLLVSPMVDFKTATSLSFKYKQYFAKEGTTLKVVLLDESKSIIGDALMTINPSEPASGFANDYTSVSVDIELNKMAKYVALYYEADENHTTGFQIKDIRLMGAEGSVKSDCNNSGSTPPSPTPPSSGNAVSSFSVDFEDNKLPEGWESKSIEGKRDWGVKSYSGNHFAQMTSYKTKETDKVLLTTPLLNISKTSTLTFKKAVRYPVDGTTLKVLLLKEDKSEISVLETYNLNTEEDFKEQTIEIVANSEAKYIGFLYEGDQTHTSMVRLDDIKLATKDSGNSNPTPPTPTPTPSGDLDLFINNYVSGSSSNKYISIYNPTDKEIDLSSYSIRMTRFNNKNLNPTPLKSELSGKIGAHETIVFSNSGAEVYKGTTVQLSVIGFSGNDPIALFKDEKIVDILGEFDKPWLIDGKDAGKYKSLHRKASINKPNATFDMSEWDELPKDDVSFLGKR